METNSEKQANNSTYQTTPSPYTPSPQQGQNGTEKSQNILQRPMIFIPVRQQIPNQRVQIPITTSLKIFLLLSGFFYCLWGIIIFSIQLGIAVNSYRTNYYGFWTGTFIDLGGILMIVYGLKATAPLGILLRTLIIFSIPCLTGFVITVINYSMSYTPCDLTTTSYCDDNLFQMLKTGLLIVFSLAIIHTPINIFYISKEYKRAIKQSYPTIANA